MRSRRSTQKAHARIVSLRCKDFVDKRLILGISPRQIARWIQREQRESLDIGEDSLVTALHRYRGEVPPLMKLACGRLGEDRGETLHKVQGDLRELETIHQLIRVQMERIRVGRLLEVAAGMPGPVVRMDIELASQLCVRAHEIKLRLGLRSL